MLKIENLPLQSRDLKLFNFSEVKTMKKIYVFHELNRIFSHEECRKETQVERAKKS
jgi:hypothetical protein